MSDNEASRSGSESEVRQTTGATEDDERDVDDDREWELGDNDEEEGGGEEDDDKSVAEASDDEIDNYTLTKEYKENPLRVNIMVDCLQMLQKIGGGLSHAFVKLVATDLNLTNMSLISNYVHLRFVDLSRNKIKDTTPLRALLFLTTLKMDGNLIQILQLQPFLYLQQASFSNNFIHLTMGFFHPSVTHFNLGFNRLKSMVGCKFSMATNLTELQLNGNKLTTLAGIDCPNLKRLYAANNRLRSFDGVETLVNLDVLHMRKNKFRSIDERIGALKNLTYLNLRQNKIRRLDSLANITPLTQLKSLTLLGNPLEKIENYRQEVLIIIPTLKKLDKEIFLEMDYQEALDVKMERKEEMRIKLLNMQMEEEEEEEEDLKDVDEEENENE